jgi:hypothetical protein
MCIGYWCESQREDQDVGGWIFLEISWGGGLAQDRDNWRALVKAVMNLRVP